MDISSTITLRVVHMTTSYMLGTQTTLIHSHTLVAWLWYPHSVYLRCPHSHIFARALKYTVHAYIHARACVCVCTLLLWFYAYICVIRFTVDFCERSLRHSTYRRLFWFLQLDLHSFSRFFVSHSFDLFCFLQIVVHLLRFKVLLFVCVCVPSMEIFVRIIRATNVI